MDYISLDELVKNPEHYYAHTGNGEKESLSEHTQRTAKYLSRLFEYKEMDSLVKAAIERLCFGGKGLSEKGRQIAFQMFVNAVVLHDIGKINPAFQKCRMQNEIFYSFTGSNAQHSILSALIYVDIFSELVEKEAAMQERVFLLILLYNFAYSISRHHGAIVNTDDFLRSLEKGQEQFSAYQKALGYSSPTFGCRSFQPDENKYNDRQEKYESWELDGPGYYILNKLLYSLIVCADFYASYEYFTGDEAEFGLIEDIEEFINTYHASSYYKHVLPFLNNYGFDSGDKVNNLRSQLFLEAEENLLKNPDQYIYYLEAPTGAGKTNTSLNLALNLIRNTSCNKLFYIFPFNTLVEQTREVFENIFPNSHFTVINSVTPMSARGEEGEDGDNVVNYEKSLLDRQFLHYPIVLTTHVNLFNWLFGTGREANFPITQLCNSVVIMDEIQSYRNVIWSEIITLLLHYAKILNIRFILMSATLPRLDKLIFDNSNFVSLITDRNKYFNNPVFSERVILDYSLLDRGRISLEELADQVQLAFNERGSTKVLVEFIKKTTAREFFTFLKDKLGNSTEIIELTGDDSKFYRNQALKKIRNSDNIIVVATQVIEAGVDIDMDIGFKDISLLDSEEQFLGRINRSGKKPGSKAFFFHYDRVEQVYREDLRNDKGLLVAENRGALMHKDFAGFYDRAFEKILQRNNSLNKNNLSIFLKECAELYYDKVSRHMRLITQNTYQIFLGYTLGTGKEMVDGNMLWEEFKSLYEDKRTAYAQKKFELSHLHEKMSLFTYSLTAYDEKQKPPFYTEECGGFYFIAGGEEYITEEGKFDREKYCAKSDGIFL